MNELIYYEEKNGEYEALYTYDINVIGKDECYARQLCTYIIVRGEQYELLANELKGTDEWLTIRHTGRNLSGEDERTFRGEGIYLEVRNCEASSNFTLFNRMPCATHFDVIRYLLKDVVHINNKTYSVTSSEIDEDRGVYVLYVNQHE